MAWRYFAQRLTGNGAGEIIDLDIPLSGPRLTRALSGPGRITGDIPIEIGRLQDADGTPLLKRWGTAIYAEASGQIRQGGILVHNEFNGQGWSLDCVGFSGYLKDLPYTDSRFFVKEDPLNIVRHIWAHAQAQPNGNLGMIVDPTTSPVLIGTELEQVEFDTQAGPVSFEAGPKKLAWWLTDDLGGEIDTLAKETPFDYLEEDAWNSDRTAIVHRLRLSYPRRGTRRHDLRFVLNENIFVPPKTTDDGEEYANAVLALGAGEGRDMVRSPIIANPDGNLRRVAVVIDKQIRFQSRANDLARAELAWRQNSIDIQNLTVVDHSHARIAELQLGDEILVQSESGYADVSQWSRIISISETPNEGDTADLTLLRTDKAA